MTNLIDVMFDASYDGDFADVYTPKNTCISDVRIYADQTRVAVQRLRDSGWKTVKEYSLTLDGTAHNEAAHYVAHVYLRCQMFITADQYDELTEIYRAFRNEKLRRYA